MYVQVSKKGELGFKQAQFVEKVLIWKMQHK